MSNNKHYTEEFKIEAVWQGTERGFAVKDVAARVGVSTWSLYQWTKRHGMPAEKRLAQDDQAAKLKRLEAELKRVTDLRELGESCGKQRVYRLMRSEGLRSQSGYRRRL